MGWPSDTEDAARQYPETYVAVLKWQRKHFFPFPRDLSPTTSFCPLPDFCILITVHASVPMNNIREVPWCWTKLLRPESSTHAVLINKCHANTQSHSVPLSPTLGHLKTAYVLAKANEWFPEKVQKASGGLACWNWSSLYSILKPLCWKRGPTKIAC